MSSSDRRHVLALLGASTIALSGCFRPMLAEGGSSAAVRGRIAFPEIDGRFGYFLGKSLEEQLGRPSDPVYRLVVTTSLEESGLAVSTDNAVTRVSLLATATWQLWQDGKDTPVLEDQAFSRSGYNATTSLFATRQTRRDIERRLARDLGERIARVIQARAGQLAS